MKTFTLSKEITWDSVNELILALDMCEDDQATIYIDSPGGVVSAGDALIHYINTSPIEITLIGSGALDSMAFELFFFSDTKKALLPGTSGIVHVGDGEMMLSEAKTGHKEWKKLVRKLSKKYNKLCEFTKQEMRDFKAGRDILIKPKRMKRLLKKLKQ